MSDDARLLRWERAATWPLTIAALLFLGAYAWPILDPHLARPWTRLCSVVDWTVWAIFVADYLARLGLARDRVRFVRRNFLDLAVVVLPVFRPLRLLRLLTLLNVLSRNAGNSFRGKVATFVVVATSLIVFISSLAVLSAERGHPGSNIDTFGNALWWCMETVTTVGYGDHYPVTVTGRFIAVGMMITGIALLGIVTASLASWLLDRIRSTQKAAQPADSDAMADLSGQVAALTKEVLALRDDLHRH